jgi:inhibitor of cysteine peptidase
MLRTKVCSVTLVLSLLTLITGACAQPGEPPSGVSIGISCDDFIKQHHIVKEVEVLAGGLLTVTLCSNPTTGFKWSETAQISDQIVLEQVDHKFVLSQSEPPPPPGTPGQEIWTFQALKKGTSTVSTEYSRPWEGGEKGEWTFVMTVVVK